MPTHQVLGNVEIFNLQALYSLNHLLFPFFSLFPASHLLELGNTPAITGCYIFFELHICQSLLDFFLAFIYQCTSAVLLSLNLHFISLKLDPHNTAQLPVW